MRNEDLRPIPQIHIKSGYRRMDLEFYHCGGGLRITPRAFLKNWQAPGSLRNPVSKTKVESN